MLYYTVLYHEVRVLRSRGRAGLGRISPGQRRDRGGVAMFIVLLLFVLYYYVLCLCYVTYCLFFTISLFAITDVADSSWAPSGEAGGHAGAANSGPDAELGPVADPRGPARGGGGHIIYVCMCVYIYREREMYVHMCVCMCICICMCVYIYICIYTHMCSNNSNNNNNNNDDEDLDDRRPPFGDACASLGSSAIQ